MQRLKSLTWTRNRKLVFFTMIGFIVLIAGFGDTRVTAITSSERSPSQSFVNVDIQGLQDVFDDTATHSISVEFDQDDYERMVETFQDSGIKEYIEATITIDGTTIASVGLRLKGNSTLAGLGGQMGLANRGGEPPGGVNPPFQAPPDDTTESEQGEGQAIPGNQPVIRGGVGGGAGADLSFDDPTSLPWLIKFDEFVGGQLYQGYTEIAVRPATSNEAMLSESLALNLIELAGEPSQQAAYASFQINGDDAQLRLLVEVPGDRYADETFEHAGVLYKALSTGQFAYRGEDPLAYADDFEQVTRLNQQDLQPLIDLLKWVNEASDDEFAEEIGEYVDVESLASYIALQELLDNFDDMSGPGQNYYLWYDLETEKFTVVSWDMNLAFGGLGGAFEAGPRGEPGALDSPRIPGAQGNNPSTAPDSTGPPLAAPGGDRPAELPGNQQLENEQLDPAQTPGAEGNRNADPGGPLVRGNGEGMGGNQLKERFLSNPDLEGLYELVYDEMFAALYGSGFAVDELERLKAVVQTSGLIDGETLASEVASLEVALNAQMNSGAEPEQQ